MLLIRRDQRPLTRRTLLQGLGGIAAAGAAAGSYAFWIEPAWRLAVAEYRLDPPGWPPGRQVTIAALTDMHVAEPYMPLSRVEEIVQATNALRPDLVVLLGDFPPASRVSRWAVPMEETASVLRGLRAPLGVQAVLGNHDWWDDLQVQRTRGGTPRIHHILEEAGIGVRQNDAVNLGGLWVAGVASLWAFPAPGRRYIGRHDLRRALAMVGDADPVVLLCHEPDIFPEVPPGRVAVTLCGHTHGGQVRILGYSPIVPSRFGNRYAYGHVIEDGKHLIVSGGLGWTIAPVRLGVPPEITLVRLGHG